jgi:hypothetical protein
MSENNYLLPDVLVREVLAHGVDAVIADLREGQRASPSADRDFAARDDLLRYLYWESPHLRRWHSGGPGDGGQYLIQHLRERAHDQGNDTLRDAYDRWLTDHNFPYFKSLDAWRYPNDPALMRILDGHSAVVGSQARLRCSTVGGWQPGAIRRG